MTAAVATSLRARRLASICLDCGINFKIGDHSQCKKNPTYTAPGRQGDLEKTNAKRRSAKKADTDVRKPISRSGHPKTSCIGCRKRGTRYADLFEYREYQCASCGTYTVTNAAMSLLETNKQARARLIDFVKRQHAKGFKNPTVLTGDVVSREPI